jgi:zinc protease
LAGCLAQPPLAPSRQSQPELAFTSFTLPNGLRSVLVTDPHADTVQVTMRYQVGAADDPPGQGGMAHLVEHLTFDQNVDNQLLTTRLARVAIYFNAETTLDATTFVSRARPAHLDDLLTIEAERLSAPCESISEAEFTREREVVLNELREREPALDAFTAIAEAVYPNEHPYHRRSAGTLESVASISRDDACAFIEAHYSIGNAVLVISGNLTRASAAGGKLATVAPRAFAKQAHVAQPPFVPKALDVSAPIEHDGLVIVWPLAADPGERARFRTVLATAVRLIAPKLKAPVATISLGDERAPMVGLLISSDGTESDADLENSAFYALKSLPELLGHQEIEELDPLAFGELRRGALYQLYGALDDASVRDPRIAAMVAEHRNPSLTLHAELEAVNGMTRDQAIEISRTQLDYGRAEVLKLKASKDKKVVDHFALTSTIEDRELRRPVVKSLDDAHKPAIAEIPATVPGAKRRKLANGLEVVLLPVSSVPTVDIRMVFRAGSGDEPAGKRGVALLAGRELHWNLRYANDVLLFLTAGGVQDVDVELDHTTFSAIGMDSQLDFLMAGLRRWIREGSYIDSVGGFTHTVKEAQAHHDQRATAADAWRAAVFGADHPYAQAGLLRHASASLTEDDADAFYAAHYTPDNATIVVTGHFDPAIVDRWIDYLFADWTGRAKPRTQARSTPRAASFAQLADGAQVELGIVLPAVTGSHAAQLVAAQMLEELAGDVRRQLGASYDLGAQVSEARLATNYVIAGAIDAPRTAEVTTFLADHIARLRTDADLAARLFVIARDRVIEKLVTTSKLPQRIEHDVDLGRAPFSDLATAAAVRDLTIDQIPFDDLDLSRAIISMRGSIDAVAPAFEVLGRKPTFIAAEPTTDDLVESQPAARPYRDTVHELADPITSPRSPWSRFTYMVAGGVSTATRLTAVTGHDDTYWGASGSLDVGYRVLGDRLLGLHLSIASLAGGDSTFTTVTKDVSAFGQTPISGRFWGGLQVGRHFETGADGFVIGGQVGLDLVPIGKHWLSLFAGYELVFARSQDGLATIALGFGR